MVRESALACSFALGIRPAGGLLLACFLRESSCSWIAGGCRWRRRMSSPLFALRLLVDFGVAAGIITIIMRKARRRRVESTFHKKKPRIWLAALTFSKHSKHSCLELRKIHSISVVAVLCSFISSSRPFSAFSAVPFLEPRTRPKNCPKRHRGNRRGRRVSVAFPDH